MESLAPEFVDNYRDYDSYTIHNGKGFFVVENVDNETGYRWWTLHLAEDATVAALRDALDWFQPGMVIADFVNDYLAFDVVNLDQ